MAFPLSVAMGIAVDYSRVTSAKQHLQASADAAALAAADMANQTKNQSDRQVLASSVGQSDYVEVGAPTVSFAESEPSSNYHVDAKATIDTPFLRLIGTSSMVIAASAEATLTTPPGKSCMLTLNPLSTSLLVNSNATINAPDCELDESNSPILNSGATVASQKYCVGTSWQTAWGANFEPSSSVNLSCTQPADPYVSSLPIPSVGPCQNNSMIVSADVTLQPGVYCGGLQTSGGGGTITLAPGLYILTQNSYWNISGNWNMRGAGVTFYFADAYSTLNFAAAYPTTGGPRFAASAPTSGTYANILMYEAPGLTNNSQMSLSCNGGYSQCMSGLIHLPSKSLSLYSPDSVNNVAVTMVAYKATFYSPVTWNMTPTSTSIATSDTKKSTAHLIQ